MRLGGHAQFCLVKTNVLKKKAGATSEWSLHSVDGQVFVALPWNGDFFLPTSTVGRLALVLRMGSHAALLPTFLTKPSDQVSPSGNGVFIQVYACG